METPISLTTVSRSPKFVWYRRAAWLVALAVALASTGCASTEPPHVTAKVIFKHEDVAAELSSEWNR